MPHEKTSPVRTAIATITTSAANFSADGAGTHAAAIAYSAVFAIAPLVIVGIGVAAQVLSIALGPHQHHVVEDRLIGFIAASIGSDSAQFIRQVVDRLFASHQGSVIAQILGWLTFIIAASGLFLSLQTALNIIWHVQPAKGFLRGIRDRIASIAMLFAIGAIILATMAFDVALPSIWHRIHASMLPGSAIWFDLLNIGGSFVVITVVMALLFKILPDAVIPWRDVFAGALVTAALFLVGEAAVGFYISKVGVASGYGAAGAIVVLLVWAYYSAMLFLFGAEITHTIAINSADRDSR
jgi:membrane protein